MSGLAWRWKRTCPVFVDAYYGPPAWRSAVEAGAPRSVAELAWEADDLVAALAAADMDADAQRRDFLARQMRAIQTSLRGLLGERLGLVEEAAGLYDIAPAWTDEAVFVGAHTRT